jgi:ice-binding like protein
MKRPFISPLAIIGIAAVLFGASAAFGQIPLGTAQNFAVLAGSTVTNTGTTIVNGSVGVSPGSSVTGFPPGIVTVGAVHAADATAAQAQSDLTTAYNTAAGMPCTTDLTGQDLGGLTLTPGVYCFTSSASLTGTLTLNFQGNPNAVFVFKIGSTLTTASASSVLLTNTGGTACQPNVYWQVGSSATLGTGSTFVGNILALTSITMTTGTTLNGRALARNGAVTLDTNTVASCAALVPALGLPGLMLLMILLAGAGAFFIPRMSA